MHGEPFAKSVGAAETGLGVVPIDQDLPAFPAGSRDRREMRSSGLATIASSRVRKCVAIRAIVAASKRSVLYSSQPLRCSSASIKLEHQVEPRDTGVHVHKAHRQSRKGRGS